MKTTLDSAVRKELISRIGALDENSAALWGKMNVYQMLKHCTLWEEMILDNKIYKQAFIGWLFGKMALRASLKDDRPLSRNTPTLNELKITGSGDLALEKAKWIGLIERYKDYSFDSFMHPFFGKMTREQVGYLAYKHSDHHLRQFDK
jgi:hypothetical protein